MKFLIDTSVHIDYVRGSREAKRWMDHYAGSPKYFSAVSVTEAERGLFLIGNPIVERRKLNDFLKIVPAIAYTPEAGKEAGRILALLSNCGNMTGYRDAMIAGHAKALGFVVVTSNPKDFCKIPGLKVVSIAKDK